ncbi:hypothetical protein B1A_04046 [mine drainage metagenome]|uniref:Uncharacterized protein n=1 Tax=mine drainage metagenome TaxID=410659 RepID=T1BR09_9ZZZZ
MPFQKCLEALGIEREAKLVRRDMKPDAELLARLGITFGTDGTVNYSKQDGLVSFETPTLNQKNEPGPPFKIKEPSPVAKK